MKLYLDEEETVRIVTAWAIAQGYKVQDCNFQIEGGEGKCCDDAVCSVEIVVTAPGLEKEATA